MSGKLRVGVLGGSFDPIHLGHIRMAQAVLDSGRVDRLLIMPNGNPSYKSCSASAEDRWKMAVAACAADKRLIPSRLELDRKDAVYTADTLSLLEKQYPEAELFLLVGSDALFSMRSWRRLKSVLSRCSVLVFPRDSGFSPDAFSAEVSYLASLGARIEVVPFSPPAFSSAGIRAAFAAGTDPAGLDPAVLEYCRCKGLYGASGRLEGIDGWMDRLFDALNPHRFAHSLCVALTAKRLAVIHGINPLKAEQAGLLHDCAKCLPLKDMQKLAVKHGITEDEAFLASGALLHSLVGSWMAGKKYGVSDPEILEAIAYHNTGFPGMSRLSMCVCLADSIEPSRASFPLLEQVRSLSEASLEKALLMSLEGTASYVLSRGLYLHPRTKDTIQWLKTISSVTGQVTESRNT